MFRPSVVSTQFHLAVQQPTRKDIQPTTRIFGDSESQIEIPEFNADVTLPTPTEPLRPVTNSRPKRARKPPERLVSRNDN